MSTEPRRLKRLFALVTVRFENFGAQNGFKAVLLPRSRNSLVVPTEISIVLVLSLHSIFSISYLLRAFLNQFDFSSVDS